MSDCHELFQDYYKKIALTDAKGKNLQKARKELRDKISKYFKEEKKEEAPLFKGQGSFYMHTIVNPLPGGDYDIDDGVYLQNLDKDKAKWASPETVHDWILKAVEGHTDKKPKDKRTCVRILYSADYHVDLPIYGIDHSTAFLAVKNEGWNESDPKNFIKWFDNKISAYGEQLRRTICYFKAWADFKKGKMVSGLAFSISASDNFSSSSRDDKALVATAKQMKSQIQREKAIKKPVVPYENLIEGWSEDDINLFLDQLDYLIQKGEEAISEDNEEKSAECWRDVFGDRFPKGETSKPKEAATVIHTSKSSPSKLWLNE